MQMKIQHIRVDHCTQNSCVTFLVEEKHLRSANKQMQISEVSVKWLMPIQIYHILRKRITRHDIFKMLDGLPAGAEDMRVSLQ